MRIVLSLVITSLFNINYAVAQDSYDDSVQFSKPIQIEGNYQQRRTSAASKLKKLRRRLEKQNEQMIQKKIETMRFKQELEMSKKLQAIFNQQMKAIEAIQ